MYILTYVKNGMVKFDPDVIGKYDYVKRIADAKAPGLMAHAVSYAYYLGVQNREPKPFKKGSLEDCHFNMGCRDSKAGSKITV